MSGNGRRNEKPGELKRAATEIFQLIFSARRLDTFANETEQPVGVGESV